MRAMRVRVKLLGTYRRYLPPDSAPAFEWEVPPGTTVEGLLVELPLPADDARVVLVNGVSPRPGYILGEGDVVSVFPAAAGG